MPHHSHYNWRKITFIGLSSLISLYLVLLGLSLFIFKVSIDQIKQSNLNHWSYSLLPITKIVFIPTQIIADGQVLVAANQIIIDGHQTYSIIVNNPQLTLIERINEADTVKRVLSIAEQLKKIEKHLNNTVFIKSAISAQQHSLLIELNTSLELIRPLLKTVTQDTHQWLIVLQNSQEIRAGGGFMGSYALVSWQDGKLANIVFEDIYDASGQLTKLPKAPPGANEYLSGNQGWKLQDMNWAADFPSAAHTILSYFTLANKGSSDTLIALNTLYIKGLLQITGPLDIPDYQTTITADNFATELRTNRDTFFAGSSQKKHLLTQVFASLQNKLTSLNQDQIHRMIVLFRTQLEQQNILFYSTDRDIQLILEDKKVTGSLALRPKTGSDCKTHDSCNGLYLYLVESNVGINKANQNIDRAVQVSFVPGDITVTITTYNKNLPLNTTSFSDLFDFQKYVQLYDNKHLAYVNYQRILTSPNVTVTQVEHDGVPIPNLDQAIINTNQGETIETGFLVVTMEQSTSRTVIHLTPNKPQLPSFITIQKQPGIPVIPYSITTPTDSWELPVNHTVTVEVN